MRSSSKFGITRPCTVRRSSINPTTTTTATEPRMAHTGPRWNSRARIWLAHRLAHLCIRWRISRRRLTNARRTSWQTWRSRRSRLPQADSPTLPSCATSPACASRSSSAPEGGRTATSIAPLSALPPFTRTWHSYTARHLTLVHSRSLTCGASPSSGIAIPSSLAGRVTSTISRWRCKPTPTAHESSKHTSP
jgi:hypothetical protein